MLLLAGALKPLDGNRGALSPHSSAARGSVHLVGGEVAQRTRRPHLSDGAVGGQEDHEALGNLGLVLDVVLGGGEIVGDHGKVMGGHRRSWKRRWEVDAEIWWRSHADQRRSYLSEARSGVGGVAEEIRG